jgi:aspartate racemase
MKTIGIIGETSWEATSLYCTYINELTHDALSHCAHLVIQVMDFAQTTEWIDKQDCDNLKNALIESAEKVEKMGADCLIFSSHAFYLFADEVQQAISIPLLHVSEASVAGIHSYSIKKIGILDSVHILESSYVNDFKRNGLEIISPDLTDCEWIQNIRANELNKSISPSFLNERIESITQNLIIQGAEGILIACPELVPLIQQHNISVPLFNTAYLHALYAVQFSLHKEEKETLLL